MGDNTIQSNKKNSSRLKKKKTKPKTDVDLHTVNVKRKYSPSVPHHHHRPKTRMSRVVILSWVSAYTTHSFQITPLLKRSIVRKKIKHHIWKKKNVCRHTKRVSLHSIDALAIHMSFVGCWCLFPKRFYSLPFACIYHIETHRTSHALRSDVG